MAFASSMSSSISARRRRYDSLACASSNWTANPLETPDTRLRRAASRFKFELIAVDQVYDVELLALCRSFVVGPSGGAATTSLRPLSGENGTAATRVASVSGGGCNTQGAITLEAADNAVCAIINNRLPTLTIDVAIAVDPGSYTVSEAAGTIAEPAHRLRFACDSHPSGFSQPSVSIKGESHIAVHRIVGDVDLLLAALSEELDDHVAFLNTWQR